MNSVDHVEDFSIGGLATLACLLEVSAPKPGNVHRGADFEDTTFYDFQFSAIALGQMIDRHLDQPTGRLILECVRSNLRCVGKNTNLGMILLLCPLAKSFDSNQPVGKRLSRELTLRTLESLNQEDTRDVYEAIRLVSPGGLGESTKMDIADAAPGCLLAAMQESEDRDFVARQYSRNFENVFEEVTTLLLKARELQDLHQAIVVAHTQLMAKFPDSLIARKCGEETARHGQLLAQKCVDQIGEGAGYWEAVSELDFWLRSDGNRRNPGTTADLIAAGLFVLLANGEIK